MTWSGAGWEVVCIVENISSKDMISVISRLQAMSEGGIRGVWIWYR